MPTLLELMQAMLRGEVPPPPVAGTIGFRLVDAAPGRAEFEMEAGPQHANPMGSLHGGVLCDLADAAMGVAYGCGLGEGESFTTLELKINFVRPFWSGRLRAVGQVVQQGQSVGLVTCDIVDDRDRLIAHASSTCMTLKGGVARAQRDA